jgi:DNA-3-methyladenine glycosylase
LARGFYRRDPREVAPDLLNKVLVHGARAGRIVEVEAYCGALDPASHAYRGPTVRNATMFGPPGGLYVYFTYGMHWCANVVCAQQGVAGAVLLRALAPLRGLEDIRAARPAARRDRDLCSGPAKLCQALGIDRTFDGADLPTADRGVTVVEDGVAPPSAPAIGRRIGISTGTEMQWRWFVPGDPNVSGR